MVNNGLIKNDKQFVVWLILLILNTLSIVIIAVFVLLSYTVFFGEIPDSITSIALTIFGFQLPLEKCCFDNVKDKQPWERTLRQALKNEKVGKDAKIRISYAAVLVIDVNGHYVLTKNPHGLETYALPARTYRLTPHKKSELEKEFHIGMCTFAERDYDDYRLFIKAKYVKKFYKKFAHDVNPLTYDYSKIMTDVLRKLNIDPSDFGDFKLEFEKRIIRPITYSRKVGAFEMFVVDKIRFEPTEKQLSDLAKLKSSSFSEVRFCDMNCIKNEGVIKDIKKFTSDIPSFVYDTLDNDD